MVIILFVCWLFCEFVFVLVTLIGLWCIVGLCYVVVLYRWSGWVWFFFVIDLLVFWFAVWLGYLLCSICGWVWI